MKTQLTVPATTMSSRDIAELLGCRHDTVKRTIENLVERGVIVQPQAVDEHSTDALGRPRTTVVYRLEKRDSHVVVAQLSPEATGRLVDRWIELEGIVAQAPTLKAPSTLREALLLALAQEEKIEALGAA
jgi:phage regulator Rha-like protein